MDGSSVSGPSGCYLGYSGGRPWSIGEDQKGCPQKGYPRKGQISLILRHFIQWFLREISRNRPHHGYPFCGDPFGPSRGQELPRTNNTDPVFSCCGCSLPRQMLCGEASCMRGKLLYLQLELFGLQLSFFAYSPLRPLLDAPSHCKQKSSNCKLGS